MSAFAATGWTFAAHLAFIFLLGIAISLREGAQRDIVTQGGSQVIAYSLGLFAILRLHAPGASIRQFLGLRATSWGVYPLALLLGMALSLPTSKLYELIITRYPLGHESGISAMWVEATTARRVAIALFVAGIGPIVEETLFRGALFAPLRRSDGASAWRAIGVISALFVMVHLTWQAFLPLAIVAVVLGFLRWRAGSIVPAMLLHIGYNSMGIGELMLPNVEMLSVSWVVVSSAAAALLFALVVIVCRGPRAAAARDEEL